MDSQKLSQLPNQSSKIGKWIETQDEYNLVLAKEDTTTIGDIFIQKKIEKLVEIVTKWNLMLGGKVLEKHEYNVILEFLKNNYSKYKVKELELVVNFSVINNSTQSLGYFQKLNCSSISVSFNQYNTYQEEMMQKINLKRVKYEQQNATPKQPTPEEKLNIHKDSLKAQFKQLDNNADIYDFGDVLFNLLVKKKQITKEQFDSFGAKAIQEWERYKNTQARQDLNIKQLKDIGLMAEKRKTFIIDFCKQQSIKSYLRGINDREKFLNELTINDL